MVISTRGSTNDRFSTRSVMSFSLASILAPPLVAFLCIDWGRPGWLVMGGLVLLAAVGGVLVADNALSHPQEIEALRDLVEQDPRLTTTTIDVGKGELVALRR